MFSRMRELFCHGLCFLNLNVISFKFYEHVYKLITLCHYMTFVERVTPPKLQKLYFTSSGIEH